MHFHGYHGKQDSVWKLIVIPTTEQNQCWFGGARLCHLQKVTWVPNFSKGLAVPMSCQSYLALST